MNELIPLWALGLQPQAIRPAEAEQVKRVKRDEARQALEAASKSAASLRLDDVAARYWRERG